MTAKEFRELGILQEVNRQFLHPRGLALETLVTEQGLEKFGEVWDNRDDPEGIVFGDGVARKEHQVYVDGLLAKKSEKRISKLGYIVQPIGEISVRKEK